MSSSSSSSQTDSIRAFCDHALNTKKAGDLDEAELICRRAQVIYARDPNIMCLLGEIVLKQGRPQEAHSWFGLALKNFPGYPRALDGTGRALLAEKKPAKAVKFLQKAAKALPNRSSTHLALGRALTMAGQGPEAESAIKRALELDPDKATVARAADALAEQRPDEAEKIIREHLGKEPDDPTALRLLGKIAMVSNRRKPAIRLLKKTVEIAPDFIVAWNDLADLYMKDEQFDQITSGWLQ